MRQSELGRASHGFDLHVGPTVPAWDRRRLERACRYLLRPPLATQRMREPPDGRLRYELRHAWRDGTVAVVLEPTELIERLIALVPTPRRHLVRYHCSLAPNARLRARIVPQAPESAAPCAEAARTAADSQPGDSKPARAGRPPRSTWAELIRRVFAVDVLVCPRCQGRLRIVATVTRPAAIRAILECLGLPARPAHPHRPHAQPSPPSRADQVR